MATLGDFDITGPLGYGGSCFVEKAINRSTSQVAALKIMRPDIDELTKKAFRREGEILRMITDHGEHKHVIKLIGEGQAVYRTLEIEAPKEFVALELVADNELFEIIRT